MRTATFALAVLSLWQICNAQTEILVPIKPSDLGLQRRDNTPIVTLQNETQLLWGGTNQSIFTNLTLKSGENELLLSTDYFSSELASLTCTSDLSLTFNSNATFQAAIADWSWVFPENRTFLMIVNYPGCTQNTDNGRQLWVVSKINNYDETNFVVDFEATLSNWTTVAPEHAFSLDFGTSTPQASEIAARDSNYVVGSELLPRLFSKSASESVNISLAHDLPNSLYSKTLYGLDFSILCPGCKTTGEIDLTGHIEYELLPPKVTVITLSATPQNVGVDLALGFEISGTLGQGWGDSVFVVPEVGLPGWSIPDIFDFGPQFSVEVGFQLSGVQGEVTIEAGMTANIPNSATAVLGIEGADSTSSGWTPTVSYTPPSLGIEVDGSLELYAMTSLDLGITVLSKYGSGAGIFMKLPDVILTLGAEYNSAGVCGGKDLFGVEFGATVGVDLELGVYTQDGGAKNWAYNHTIYQNNNLITPIEKCFGLGDTLSASASGVSISSTGTPITSTATTSKPVITTSSIKGTNSTKTSSILGTGTGTAVTGKLFSPTRNSPFGNSTKTATTFGTAISKLSTATGSAILPPASTITASPSNLLSNRRLAKHARDY